jgi:hypothetical protein
MTATAGSTRGSSGIDPRLTTEQVKAAQTALHRLPDGRWAAWPLRRVGTSRS